MSSSSQTAGPSTSASINNFTVIFDAASTEYQRVTGRHLDTHPFATQLDACQGPGAVSDLFRTHAQAFTKFRKGDDRLMTWLDPIVNILFTFSATLGVEIGIPFSPAKTIFTGIGVLLGAIRDVAAGYDALIHLFERIHMFLGRLNRYTGIPLTEDLTELLGKIMAQLLSILALSTKAMTDGRIKKVLKRLAGRSEMEDAVSRLDTLTKDENIMIAAQNLEITHRVDRKVDRNFEATKYAIDKVQRNQLQDKFRSWLSPPNPSINHNTACDIQHDGTATWFIQCNTFREWKENGSLLWIRGNPGAGKSILCSAIIEDCQTNQDAGSALVAYYYFDYKDTSKRDIRGLLASLVFQLGSGSVRCWGVLHQLYAKCRDGSNQPSNPALANCLEDMLKLPGQLPTFIILDALDECPNDTETPSNREKVLNFLENLVRSQHTNLFLCVTSRPEQDIQSVFNPLTLPSRRVSLHNEVGQREAINMYLHSFVQTDRVMRRWKEEDKELVINTLSERANGMFRWVFCQLDTLRRCMPSSIRKALDELPTSLDDTYERALQGIPKEKRQHAHRLFQCLVAAIRPLSAEELAEIFAVDFDQGATCNFMEDWRPENPEEAVLSTCSTLITVIEDDSSRIIQFSHFSVKEFLTSDRLRTSEDGGICGYYISLDCANALFTRACLTVLMQLDENMDRKRVKIFPLVSYAARYWVEHAKYGGVELRVQDAMEEFFNPKNLHLAAWISMVDVAHYWDVGFLFEEFTQQKSSPETAALIYAAFCGFSGVANYLIITHAADKNAHYQNRGAPLHVASRRGHAEVVSVLLQHDADVNLKCTTFGNWTSLHFASACGHAKVAQLLLEHGAEVDAQTMSHATPLWWASFTGHLEVVRLLLRNGADARIRHDEGTTPLRRARRSGHVEVAQLLDYDAETDCNSVVKQW